MEGPRIGSHTCNTPRCVSPLFYLDACSLNLKKRCPSIEVGNEPLLYPQLHPGFHKRNKLQSVTSAVEFGVSNNCCGDSGTFDDRSLNISQVSLPSIVL